MTAGGAPKTALIEALATIVGERVTTAAAVREAHGRDESWHAPHPPDAVVFPECADEVVEIVRLCAAHRTPIIPYGAGTSLEGHVAALRGGVTIDMARMDRVLEVNAGDLDIRVEAGVTRKRLNEDLRDTGLFFPVDPGADATLGGMAATRASGTNAVRYGTMRENVLALGVVLSDGRLIRTGTRARKSAAGYDLTRLFVGSEGTLGVIVDVTVRLYGIPEAISAAVCPFPSVEAAVEACIAIIQAGIPVARVELADEEQMTSFNAYSGTNLPASPNLFFEFHGSHAAAREQAEAAQAIAADHGAADFQWATRAEDRGRLWQARHDAHYANVARRPGARGWPTDVCVPISRLAECIAETRADIAACNLLAPMVGHVGDGNFHVEFVVDPDDAAEVAEARRLNDRLIARALALGGTCTGEHGVGYGKIDYLADEHGEALDLMRDLKRAFDPDNLMNPGKIVAP